MIDLVGLAQSGMGQMSGMAITATIGVVAVTLAFWTVVRPSRFPPGPRGWPIVGSIFDMTDKPEIVFAKWAKKYGNIFGLKVGDRWMVVLNGQEAIKDAVVKQGIDFAGRPEFYSMEIFTDGFKDIVFSPYSETWKLHRKLAHTALRHFATGKPLQDLISGTYPKIQKALEKQGDTPTDPKVLITQLIVNVISQMSLGKSYALDDPLPKTIIDMIERFDEDIGLGLAADFFPWARYIPSSGPKMMKNMTNEVTTMLKGELEHTKANYDPDNISDFYSLLRKAQDDAKAEGENVEKLTDSHVYQTLSDIFFASIETSVGTLYWALALIAEHPEVQSKVQSEIDRVVGRSRVPTIDDRGTLPYTEATLFEVMRYSSIVSVGIPHATTRDTEFRGYLIPKGTVVMVNTYSMHFDPTEWDDPESFKPEHFLDDAGTVRQHPPSFMPFGAGRRACLGEAVAKADLFLIFTWFLQNYSFSKLPGKEDESIVTINEKVTSARMLSSYEICIKSRP